MEEREEEEEEWGEIKMSQLYQFRKCLWSDSSLSLSLSVYTYRQCMYRLFIFFSLFFSLYKYIYTFGEVEEN